MTGPRDAITRRTAAKVAGWSYLAIGVAAMFANFFVLLRVVEPGDAAATASSIQSSAGLFRLAVVAFLVVVALDLVIAWGLHVIFRHANRDLSLLTAWSRALYAALFGAAAMNLAVVPRLLGPDGGLAGTARDAQVLLSVEAFNDGWMIALSFFGLHLLLLGALVLRTRDVPRPLGVLLLVAGGAYAADTLASVALPSGAVVADVTAMLVVVPSIVGELWLGFWLLLRGGRTPSTERAAMREPEVLA